MRIIYLALFTLACTCCSLGTRSPDPSPDAVGPPQSCASYGSDCQTALCARDGSCSCELPDGMTVTCERGSGF